MFRKKAGRIKSGASDEFDGRDGSVPEPLRIRSLQEEGFDGAEKPPVGLDAPLNALIRVYGEDGRSYKSIILDGTVSTCDDLVRLVLPKWSIKDDPAEFRLRIAFSNGTTKLLDVQDDIALVASPTVSSIKLVSVVHDWFAEGMSESETKKAVKAGMNGSFLVWKKNASTFVLIVNAKGHPTKLSIKASTEGFTMGAMWFETLDAAIHSAQSAELRTANGSRVILSTPAAGGVPWPKADRTRLSARNRDKSENTTKIRGSFKAVQVDDGYEFVHDKSSDAIPEEEDDDISEAGREISQTTLISTESTSPNINLLKNSESPIVENDYDVRLPISAQYGYEDPDDVLRDNESQYFSRHRIDAVPSAPAPPPRNSTHGKPSVIQKVDSQSPSSLVKMESMESTSSADSVYMQPTLAIGGTTAGSSLAENECAYGDARMLTERDTAGHQGSTPATQIGMTVTIRSPKAKGKAKGAVPVPQPRESECENSTSPIPARRELQGTPLLERNKDVQEHVATRKSLESAAQSQIGGLRPPAPGIDVRRKSAEAIPRTLDKRSPTARRARRVSTGDVRTPVSPLPKGRAFKVDLGPVRREIPATAQAQCRVSTGTFLAPPKLDIKARRISDGAASYLDDEEEGMAVYDLAVDIAEAALVAKASKSGDTDIPVPVNVRDALVSVHRMAKKGKRKKAIPSDSQTLVRATSTDPHEAVSVENEPPDGLQDWRFIETSDGKVYYYNTKTKQTSWTLPVDIESTAT